MTETGKSIIQTSNRKILIIGGGASGMMAAIAAADHGAGIRVLERLSRVGKKLLATGNGRCNLSNRHMEPDYFHGDPDFIQSVLSRFGLDRTIRQFEAMGLAWISDPEGRIYPRSLQASGVLDLLRNAMAQRGVVETCETSVQQIKPQGRTFRIMLGDGSTLEAGRVILAAGGRAYPSLGSNGSGFRLAGELGHTIRSPRPAIVQLTWKQKFSRRLKGLKVQARIVLTSDGNALRTESGEILFTEDGLSGIPALQMAQQVHACADKGITPVLHISLFPELDKKTFREQFLNRLLRFQDQPLPDTLITLIHKRLIPVLLSEAGIHPDTLCSQLSDRDRNQLIQVLTDWQIPVTGTRSWSSAQVTAGGIATDEVNPETLESKIITGLYFAGEILDVDGDCGGYNLQWAWSSGRLAGRHAALD